MSKSANIKRSIVKGGWVGRDSTTGKFRIVGTVTAVSKSSVKTIDTVQKVSRLRSAAMERLVHR